MSSHRHQNPFGPLFGQPDDHILVRYKVHGIGQDNAGDVYPDVWAPPAPDANWDSDEWMEFEEELLKAMQAAGIPARPVDANDPTSGTAHGTASHSLGPVDQIIWHEVGPTDYDDEDRFHLLQE